MDEEVNLLQAVHFIYLNLDHCLYEILCQRPCTYNILCCCKKYSLPYLFARFQNPSDIGRLATHLIRNESRAEVKNPEPEVFFFMDGKAHQKRTN
jgi:hypothetical protein